MRKPLRLLDIPVAILILFAFFRLPATSGADAKPALSITTDGKTLTEPLAPDRTLKVEGALGSTVVEVKGGKARIAESPCAGKQCARTGWVGTGEGAAICAPNRVAVRVTGQSGGVDAILR